MTPIKCNGKWGLYEVIAGVGFVPVSYGYVVAWDVIRGQGKIAQDTRIWVGSLTKRAGFMTPYVTNVFEVDEGIRFFAGRKTYELRRVESLNNDRSA
jgi:hypothetical protein